MVMAEFGSQKRKADKWVVVGLGAILATLVGLFIHSRWEISQIEIQYPPVGQWVQLDGFRMHYIDKGNGPALVLIHGSTTTLRDFAASIFEPLSHDCRVVAFDRPGHGYSSYPAQLWMDPAAQAVAIHDALRQLGIKRAVWVGHSWAGAIVMAGLLKYPHAVTAGVLLGGAAYPWQGGVDWSNHIADIPIVGKIFTHLALVPVGRWLMDQTIAAAFLPN